MSDDCISRQAVLDTLDRMLIYADDTKTKEEYYLLVNESVKVLPSVTPQFYPPCEDCNKKMDEIRKAYDKLQDRPTVIEDIKAEIEKQIERDFAFSESEELKVPCHYGIANGLQVAIRIIDNHIGGENNVR